MPIVFMYKPKRTSNGRWVIDEVCTCGCLMTIHEKRIIEDGHGACTHCPTCRQFTFKELVFAKTP